MTLRCVAYSHRTWPLHLGRKSHSCDWVMPKQITDLGCHCANGVMENLLSLALPQPRTESLSSYGRKARYSSMPIKNKKNYCLKEYLSSFIIIRHFFILSFRFFTPKFVVTLDS